MKASEIKKAEERYNIILDILSKNNDKIGLEFLEALVDSVANYNCHIARMEHRMKQWKYTMEEREYMEAVAELDKTRRSYHESMISNLMIMNRYLFKNYNQTPIGGIYSLDPTTIKYREAVADWAGFLYSALDQRNSSNKKQDLNI